MSFEEGDLVAVSKPHKNYNGEWLLPGEKIYVVGKGSSDRLRVRCPASGADMWIDEEIVHLVESVKPVTEPERMPESDLWIVEWFRGEDEHAGGKRRMSIMGDVLNVHIRRDDPGSFEDRYYRLVPIDDPDKETDD